MYGEMNVITENIEKEWYLISSRNRGNEIVSQNKILGRFDWTSQHN
jgi:hypothetical protein